MKKPGEFDQESYEDMIQLLQSARMSVKDLSTRYEMTDRTIYRWLGYAEADGWDVVKRGTNPVLYTLEVPG